MDNKEKEYREERFEFTLHVNNNLICKRNFKINNFIEDSTSSIDFKEKVDEIVEMINCDLKSKSRVYTWYYFDENSIDEEFTDPLIDPWACTFKFTITDNKEEVISKIWDGYAYPKSVREKVDIANRIVKITSKDGTRTYSYDKETFFEMNADKLSIDNYILRAMIMDKPDLLVSITKKICETCSNRDGAFKTIRDFTLGEVFRNKEYQADENGQLQATKITKNKKYLYSPTLRYNKIVSDWGKAVEDKTRNYFDNLF